MKWKLWLLLSLLVSLPLLAEKYTGSIQGTVSDSTGAVVSGAQITIKNPGTGDTRTITSSAEGTYSVQDLPAGMYEVTTKAPNFKTSVTKDVEIHTASATTVNVGLTAGGATEEVTVEANAVQVETATGAVGNVVDGKEVRELPLNGRSFVQLTQLMPGVSPAANFDSKNKGLMSGVDFSVNGNTTGSNLYLVDGVNNNDIGSNRTILVYPGIDAIQEFKILRNSYPPEYGQAAGAIVSIITRGGTNQFHGSAFYEGRNAALNATDYFNTRSGQPKDALERNDYGYTIGGPVVKDKLFFFWEQEWNHEQRGALRQSQVPNAGDHVGDFSDTLPFSSNLGRAGCESAPKNPSTGIGGPVFFTNISQVPFGGTSPGGLDVLALYPLPNVTPTPGSCTNWAQSFVSPIRWRQENARVDFKIAPTWSLMGRITHDSWSQPFPSTLNFWGDDPFPAIESNWSQPGKQATVKLTKLFGSTAVNDFQISYAANKITVTQGGLNPGLNAQLDAAIPTDFPQSDKSHTDIGHPLFWGGLSGIGGGQNLWTQGPWVNNEQLFIYKDDFSKVVGAHTFKFGAIATNNQKNEETQNSSGENVAFWGSAPFADSANRFGGSGTGNSAFDILWDQMPWGGQENQGNPNALGRWHDYEFYFGDNWKARRNLTVEYGFRWSFIRRPYSGADTIGNFVGSDWSDAFAGSPCDGTIVPKSQAGTCAADGFAGGGVGDNRSLQPNNNHTIAPRLGIAWDPTGSGKWAIRGGAGQFYLREHVSAYTTTMASNPPFNLFAGNLNRLLSTPVPPGAGGSPSNAIDLTSVVPNTWQWNFTIERELAQNTKLEIGYVANRQLHLFRWNDANAVPIGQRLNFATDQNLQPADLTLPAITTTQNSLRPFGADAAHDAGGSFGLINEGQWEGSGNYHSLQALFKTRVKGLDAQFAYTWSHSLADTDVTSAGGANGDNVLDDPFNPHLNYGNTYINRPNVLVGNLVYTLPTFAGKSALQRYAVGGWEISSILSYGSGSSVTVFANGAANGLVSGFTGTGARTDSVRPLRVPGQPCRASGATDKTQWLNPNAWTLQGFEAGTVTGNAADPLSAFGECSSPGIANTDLSIHKNFKATERVNVQFRMDFFNVFNKTQFLGINNGNQGLLNTNILGGSNATACTLLREHQSPSTTPGSDFAPGGACAAQGVDNRIVFDPSVNEGGNFGKVFKDKGPREIQYQLRFEF